MTCYPYDDLASWRGAYTAEALEAQFRKLARGWAEGVALLELAVAAAPKRLRPEAAEELGLARAAGTYWASLANQVRFVALRDERLSGREEERSRLWSRLLEDEIALARTLHGLARSDSRIGFEAANQYFYVPLDLVEKVVSCEQLRAAGVPGTDRGRDGKDGAR
jgi:hypothetical protein